MKMVQPLDAVHTSICTECNKLGGNFTFNGAVVLRSCFVNFIGNFFIDSNI